MSQQHHLNSPLKSMTPFQRNQDGFVRVWSGLVIWRTRTKLNCAYICGLYNRRIDIKVRRNAYQYRNKFRRRL